MNWEHYLEAERLLALAKSMMDNEQSAKEISVLATCAQAHATLAAIDVEEGE